MQLLLIDNEKFIGITDWWQKLSDQCARGKVQLSQTDRRIDIRRYDEDKQKQQRLKCQSDNCVIKTFDCFLSVVKKRVEAESSRQMHWAFFSDFPG